MNPQFWAIGLGTPNAYIKIYVDFKRNIVLSSQKKKKKKKNLETPVPQFCPCCIYSFYFKMSQKIKLIEKKVHNKQS